MKTKKIQLRNDTVREREKMEERERLKKRKGGERGKGTGKSRY